MSLAVGADIGGTAIKVAVVDLAAGRPEGAVRTVPTPAPGTPGRTVAALGGLVGEIDPSFPIGVGFPGAIRGGRAETAFHLDRSWIGTEVHAAFAGELTGRRVAVLNDADAAALAERRFGAAAGVTGVVVMVTLGTGIGTALLHDGVLVPNTEFGHMEVDGADAELLVSGRLRTRDGMTWEEWGGRLARYLSALESLLWPDLFVIGGGISSEFDRFARYLPATTPVVPAGLGNAAGIVGAALAAGGEGSG